MFFRRSGAVMGSIESLGWMMWQRFLDGMGLFLGPELHGSTESWEFLERSRNQLGILGNLGGGGVPSDENLTYDVKFWKCLKWNQTDVKSTGFFYIIQLDSLFLFLENKNKISLSAYASFVTQIYMPAEWHASQKFPGIPSWESLTIPFCQKTVL